jgi:hypothetical protein
MWVISLLISAQDISCDMQGMFELIEQVCYSWWDLAALSILGRLHWINKDTLISFILGAQVRPLPQATIPCGVNRSNTIPPTHLLPLLKEDKGEYSGNYS